MQDAFNAGLRTYVGSLTAARADTTTTIFDGFGFTLDKDGSFSPGSHELDHVVEVQHVARFIKRISQM